MERFDGMWWSERNGVLELRGKSLCKKKEVSEVGRRKEKAKGERTGYTGGTE